MHIVSRCRYQTSDIRLGFHCTGLDIDLTSRYSDNMSIREHQIEMIFLIIRFHQNYFLIKCSDSEILSFIPCNMFRMEYIL